VRAGTVRARSQRAAELDEMWSFVGAKEDARWLWHALDHHTGRVLAYVVGTRKDAEFLKLRALLAPFGITRYYTDKAGVYRGISRPRSTQGGSCRCRRSNVSTSRCGRASSA
jgi:insertion element IS1 protein InsB